MYFEEWKRVRAWWFTLVSRCGSYSPSNAALSSSRRISNHPRIPFSNPRNPSKRIVSRECFSLLRKLHFSRNENAPRRVTISLIEGVARYIDSTFCSRGRCGAQVKVIDFHRGTETVVFRARSLEHIRGSAPACGKEKLLNPFDLKRTSQDEDRIVEEFHVLFQPEAGNYTNSYIPIVLIGIKYDIFYYGAYTRNEKSGKGGEGHRRRSREGGFGRDIESLSCKRQDNGHGASQRNRDGIRDVLRPRHHGYPLHLHHNNRHFMAPWMMVKITIIAALAISLFLVEEDCPFLAILGGRAGICERLIAFFLIITSFYIWFVVYSTYKSLETKKGLMHEMHSVKKKYAVSVPLEVPKEIQISANKAYEL